MTPQEKLDSQRIEEQQILNEQINLEVSRLNHFIKEGVDIDQIFEGLFSNASLSAAVKFGAAEIINPKKLFLEVAKFVKNSTLDDRLLAVEFLQNKLSETTRVEKLLVQQIDDLLGERVLDPEFKLAEKRSFMLGMDIRYSDWLSKTSSLICEDELQAAVDSDWNRKRALPPLNHHPTNDLLIEPTSLASTDLSSNSRTLQSPRTQGRGRS